MSKKLPRVAYFCMEYGVHHSLKTYAGGLGILAGDYIKGAKDHDYPIVAIGIKWKQGYTDQYIDEDGQPYDSYRNYDYDFLEDTGVSVAVTIRKQEVQVKVWKCEQFGHVPLYLLDTDIPDNPDSWVCGQLYGWFGEERVAQEIVLGVGGVRALRALGIEVDQYHFNEGHALFAGFELLREKMENQAMSFEAAREAVKPEIVFTTHTPVLQGNESHPIDRLVYMGADLGLSRKQLASLGGEPFNMTVGALRMAKISNAVAQLHGETANEMWDHVEDRSEIIAITNAVHLPTWTDANMVVAAEGKGDLWATHMKNKRSLIDFVRQRNGVELDEDKIIIGFSRRAAPYKRANLIFQKPDIINPLLESGRIQIVFSGKAHPLDDTGKALVADLVKMERQFPQSVVFIQNYDMPTGAALTRGSDVWLNNPRRPKEASGTSGMKAAINGVLNVSVLDGWWPEACEHGVTGWQFGDGYESEDIEKQDRHDLNTLYEVLLEEVLPTYYGDRDKWVEMMRNSILRTKDEFAVARMLREYYDRMYLLDA